MTDAHPSPRHYTATFTSHGWFYFTAESDEDAMKVAAELARTGPPSGADFEDCIVDYCEQDDA